MVRLECEGIWYTNQVEEMVIIGSSITYARTALSFTIPQMTNHDKIVKDTANHRVLHWKTHKSTKGARNEHIPNPVNHNFYAISTARDLDTAVSGTS